MMDQDRNLGVTEARFGLTLLICLLVAIGYVVLLRLGGTSESTVEVRPGGELQGGVVRDETTPKNENEPQVLPIEPPKASEPRMSTRPAPPESPESAHTENKSAPSADPEFPAGSTDSQRR